MKSVIHILLIDDDEDDYFITADLLRDIEGQRYQLDWQQTYDGGQAAIDQQKHDIYLIDYRLGPENGLTLLRVTIALGNKTPIILLTGQGDKEVDIEAMQAGAADYLVKGQINAQVLERSIRYAIERRRVENSKLRLEQQLRQAQKMDAIGQLAGGIAHDFNNVLTAIMSYAGVSRRMIPHDHEIQSRLKGIEEAGQRAANLTRQLLAFASRQVITPKNINLNQLVLNLNHMLRRLINTNIEFITRTTDELWQIKADPGQMEQVLINLVVNARDAMPNGGKLIIETANVVLDSTDAQQHVDIVAGEYAMLAVTDTGMGMNEEIKARIFEPFFTTKEVGKGTGLGLATCYGIIRQNKGYIWVYSEPGKGTSFKTYLPRTYQSTPVPEEALRQFAELPRGNETILLAEDEPAIREMVATILEQHGYTVITATDGAEALIIAEAMQEKIHLLLTDVVMPHMDGSMLSKAVINLYPDIKIIFVSGYPDNAVIHNEIVESKRPFLQKPFSTDAIVRKVRAVLDS